MVEQTRGNKQEERGWGGGSRKLGSGNWKRENREREKTKKKKKKNSNKSVTSKL